MKIKTTKNLRSRYKHVTTDAYIADDVCYIISDNHYTRYIYNPKDDKTLDAIDFEGGPMLNIGDTIFNKKIKSITPGYILELEKIEIEKEEKVP